MADFDIAPADLAALDQIHREAITDLDAMVADPAIHRALFEDGTALAAARLTYTLHEDFSEMAVAGFAALAILRLVELEQSRG